MKATALHTPCSLLLKKNFLLWQEGEQQNLRAALSTYSFAALWPARCTKQLIPKKSIELFFAILNKQDYKS